MSTNEKNALLQKLEFKNLNTFIIFAEDTSANLGQIHKNFFNKISLLYPICENIFYYFAC